MLLLRFVVDEIWQWVLIKVSFGSCPWNAFRFIFVRSSVRFKTSVSSFEISYVSQPGSSRAMVDTTFWPLCLRRRSTVKQQTNERRVFPSALFRCLVGVTWRMDGVGLVPRADFDIQVLLEMHRESACDVRRCCRLCIVVTSYTRGSSACCAPSNGSSCASRTLLSPCRRPTFPGIGSNAPERDLALRCRLRICSVLLVQQVLFKK